MQKSKFLTFVLSWLPGLGHLYLGLNRRGLQFMIGFFACIALTTLLPIMSFAIAVLWFYSLFDALQKVSLMNSITRTGASKAYSTAQVASDEQLSALDKAIDPMSLLRGEKHTVDPIWIGGACILVGLLIFVRKALPAFWFLLERIHLGSILLALLLIGFGVWLIRKQLKKS